MKNWECLNYLPKNINKNEYIDYLSRCQYPLWLGMIHFQESSFNTNAGNGSYIGLGQHHPDFIRECGYSIKEYKSSWKVQLYVSLEYIKKHVNRVIKGPHELYAYWLKSNWNGENNIYCRNSRLPNGKNPYIGNRRLDLDKNGCIEIKPDFVNRFKKLLNVY